MGNTEAYIGSVSLEWLDSRVRLASKLPLFREKFDSETDNIILDSETINEIQQRPLDCSRQAPLTLYLATRKSHKFPAVLVVISPSLVDNSKAKEWNQNGEANQSATDFLPLDSVGKLGLLELSLEVAVFALDGQHRLTGIQGLMELIKTGRLSRYNKQKSIAAAITIDDLAETHQV